MILNLELNDKEKRHNAISCKLWINTVPALTMKRFYSKKIIIIMVKDECNIIRWGE